MLDFYLDFISCATQYWTLEQGGAGFHPYVSVCMCAKFARRCGSVEQLVVHSVLYDAVNDLHSVEQARAFLGFLKSTCKLNGKVCCVRDTGLLHQLCSFMCIAVCGVGTSN